MAQGPIKPQWQDGQGNWRSLTTIYDQRTAFRVAQNDARAHRCRVRLVSASNQLLELVIP